jgi:hypothetical protein
VPFSNLMIDFVCRFEVDPSTEAENRRRELAFRDALGSMRLIAAAIAASNSSNARAAAELVEAIDGRRHGA